MKHGLARVLSKLGYCSRSQARALITAGRVQFQGRTVRDPEHPVSPGERDRITVDGEPVAPQECVYLMLNKPRGLITTASDDRNRETVFRCLDGQGLPFLSPVGRLDKASEGLLLFTNDTVWAARITDPETHLDKVYHVQVNCLAGEELLRQIQQGVEEASGEFLAAKSVRVLRRGQKNAWVEIVLDEGKNRHIRRLLEALQVAVLRLVRVQIGGLPLGSLGKGQFRHLTAEEVAALAGSSDPETGSV